jgi:dipeptidyl-peptidase-4
MILSQCVFLLICCIPEVSPAAPQGARPAAVSGVQQVPSDPSTRQPLTFDLVHGTNRLNLAGSPAGPTLWLDDSRWVQPSAGGWDVVTAADGAVSAWYDAAAVASALQSSAGLAADTAKRLSTGGWTDLLPTRSLALFHSGEKLIRLNLTAPSETIVLPISAGAELVTLSPAGDSAAFILNANLWIADFTSQTLRQLTHDGSATLRNGKADWVYFEEVYNRSWKAFRFSPDGQWLAFQQFNDAAVPVFRISDHSTVLQEFEVENYPQAGQTNPTVRLGVVAAAGGEISWIDTGSYADDDFLLVNFQWLPDSSGVLWAAQNREQTWLDLLHAPRSGQPSRKLLRDQTPAWTDNHGDVKVLGDGSFLMFSERTGWKHLYKVTADGSTITPITHGDWEVRSLVGVAADEQSLLIAAAKNSRIADAIFRVSLTDPGTEPECLTPEDGHHAANASPGCKWFSDTQSTFQQPPETTLRSAAGEVVRILRTRQSLPIDKYRFGSLEMRDVPMADGSTTKAIFVFPADFQPEKRYPVWLRTYAGPHAPQVKNQWNPRLADHLLAEHGIVVVTFDPRTASGYGACSAWPAWKRLGIEETRDLETVCRWLGEQSWVDRGRIGLSGHSYGGYFTAYAMTHLDCICAGISGAPVTDWAHYDTIYTERFMSTPQRNPEGYRNSSVVNVAANLRGRLLLLHGMKDDNVHPENTLQLVHALQQADRQFELMIYPPARHGIFGTHYQRLLFEFVLRNMGRAEAIPAAK